MAEKVVLDTSAILRSNHDFRGGDYMVTNGVLGELKLEKDRDAVASAVNSGYIRVVEPGERSKKAVSEAAKDTGDSTVLSLVDADLLALALETGANLASDDYAIQNTAKKLKIKVLTTYAEGISQERRWVLACSGCGKKSVEKGTCSICGHRIVRKSI